MTFCNTKSNVTLFIAKLNNHTRCTLLLRVADGYVGCLHRVSTDDFNTVLKNKGNALVKVTHKRVRVPIVGAEIEKLSGLGSVPNKHKRFSFVQIMQIG